jgi:multimeric flavodoxin WrbA
MENKTVIILGSSRSDGNTRKIVDTLVSLKSNIDVIDICNYDIGYYDYSFENKDDDFFELYKKVITYETIIFATPVYWYSMSAQLKTFFDRISDVLHGDKKEFGRKLRGKNMALVSCSSDAAKIKGFTRPFKETANYLGMNYKGYLHAWVEPDNSLNINLRKKIKLFIEKL